MKSNTHSIDILSQLIAFDTTSRNSNLDIIDFIQSILEPWGIQSELTFDTGKNKANLFATLGDSKQSGLVLSGHTDVVPVDDQDWNSDPFKAEIRDSRMYGRGVCDMKGFIAICLTRIEQILNADLSTPIHFAFSFDEEVGCLGVRELLSALKKKPVLPKACIIGEPTSMGVIRAHKGMLFKRCCVRGKSAHSSLVHQGVNAVTVASKIISHIDAMQRRIQKEGPFDEAFEPPYTTLHSGVITGGTVNNIIPSHCQFDFEIRNLPEQQTLPIFEELDGYVRTQLIPEMHGIDPETGVDWMDVAEYPGMNTAKDEAVISLVSELLGFNDEPGKVSYGTEGGHFQRHGIPTVICGPGSIEQAHKPDEFVDLDQIDQGEKFISSLIESLT